MVGWRTLLFPPIGRPLLMYGAISTYVTTCETCKIWGYLGVLKGLGSFTGTYQE